MIFSELISSAKNSKNFAADEIWEFIEKISEASVNSFEISRALVAIELIEQHMSIYGITDKSFAEYFDIFFQDISLYPSVRSLWTKGLINMPKRPVEDFISQVLKYNLVTQAQYLLPDLTPESYSTSEDGVKWSVPKLCEAIPKKPQGKKKTEVTVQEDSGRYEFIPFKEEFIPMIPKLLDAVYKGDYPYEQFYDPEWLRKQIHDYNVYFRVFWDNETKQVVGFTYHYYNPVTKGVYMGSTVIDPEYQSKGVVSHLQNNWMGELVKTYKPLFLWGEIRACDCRMQKYLEHMGFKPIVFLLDFDTGMGNRESEIILVYYLQDLDMHEEVKTLPQIKPLIEYALNNFGIKRKLVYINPNAELVDSIFKLPENFQFDTHYFPGWDGQLELKMNPENLLRVMTNEKHKKKLVSVVMGKSRVRIEINASAQSARILCGGLENGPQGKILLNWLDLWLRLNNFHYLDVFVSSTEPFVQAWFLKNKWECAGYFPLFFPNVLTNTPEDAVVFRLPSRVETKKLMLTEKALELCNLILPKSCFNFEWNGELKFATLSTKPADNLKEPVTRPNKLKGKSES